MSQEAIPIWRAYFEESAKHTGDDFKVAFERRVQEIKEKSVAEKKLGCLAHKGSMEWSGIRTQEEFDTIRLKAYEEYLNGTFFLERIGRFRSVDAPLTLTMLNLRGEWIREYDVQTVPEFMLLDMALTSYFHFVRLNQDVNEIMAGVEFDFFAMDAPRFRISHDGKRLNSEAKDEAMAEALAYRLKEILQPMLEQYNRMFIRNLKALRDLRRGNIMLNIGNVGQVNIGEKQVNMRSG